MPTNIDELRDMIESLLNKIDNEGETDWEEVTSLLKLNKKLEKENGWHPPMV